MDEDAPHQMRWPRVVARVIGYPILALVFYVLSAGPAFYLLKARSLELDAAVNRIYAPVFVMGFYVDVFALFFFPYMAWWGGLPGGPNERLLRESTPLPAVNDLAL